MPCGCLCGSCILTAIGVGDQHQTHTSQPLRGQATPLKQPHSWEGVGSLPPHTQVSQATGQDSYLGLRRELLAADCREGVLTASVARDREQLIQDCRLPSGWELMTETLSLEAKVRTLITVAITVRTIIRPSLHAVSLGPTEHSTGDVVDGELVPVCEMGGSTGIWRGQARS